MEGPYYKVASHPGARGYCLKLTEKNINKYSGSGAGISVV